MTYHSKLYQRLMNSREWRETRTRKLQRTPLCEEHYKTGKYVAASVVHHIVEVESGHTEHECRRLCFDPSNLESLCRECHAEIHMTRGYHTAAAHQRREDERLKRWASRLERSSGDSEHPAPSFLCAPPASPQIHHAHSDMSGQISEFPFYPTHQADRPGERPSSDEAQTPVTANHHANE